MPSVRSIELPDRATVGSAFEGIRNVALPEELLRDDLAQWVISHDSVRRGDYDEPVGHQEWTSDSNPGAYLLAATATNVFRQSVPFYFATLFHIGRIWTVSTNAIREISQLAEPDTLTIASADVTRAMEEDGNLARRSDLRGPDIRNRIAAACQEATSLHGSRLTNARSWWALWKDEVRRLRDGHDRVQRQYNESAFSKPQVGDFRELGRSVAALLVVAQRPSRLVDVLRLDGVRFQHGANSFGVETQLAASPAWWFPMLAALAEDSPDWPDHLAHELRQAIHESAFIDRQRLLASKAEITLRLLEVRCGDTDPFAAFGVTKGVPSFDLVVLYQQHRLADGSDSPWLAQWKAQLSRLQSTGVVPLTWQPLQTELARTADSEIKLGVCEQYHTRRISEGWSDFVQRIFEAHWIGRLAERVVGKSNATMSSTEFAVLVQAIVDQLNGTGYTLVAPSMKRFETLFQSLQAGKTSFEIYREGF